MTSLLDVADLTVRFGGLTAVSGVHFSLAKGELRGLIGPNGAGKTTFFNALTGLVTPAGGKIRLAGEDVTDAKPHVLAGLGIRRTFQTMQLMMDFSVLENVLIGLHVNIPSNPLLYFLRGRELERRAIDRTREVLTFLDLDEVMMDEVSKLTFAQQRYVEIARALVAHPKLLLLDEPAAGLSPAEVEKIARLLKMLRDEWGMTILLVEHVISLVMATCDRITVLDQGRLIAEGDGPSIAANPQVRVAYLGQGDDPA